MADFSLSTSAARILFMTVVQKASPHNNSQKHSAELLESIAAVIPDLPASTAQEFRCVKLENNNFCPRGAAHKPPGWIYTQCSRHTELRFVIYSGARGLYLWISPPQHWMHVLDDIFLQSMSTLPPPSDLTSLLGRGISGCSCMQSAL